MKGDFTRSTFRPEKHYSSVRMQQGRVQLDADWNEQLDITAHRLETEAADVIGGCGGPLAAAGFALTGGPVPKIGKGRYYVDGILCENEADLDLDKQPDLPGISLGGLADGLYLAYLDVWQRHITALEDDAIREVALGGPDTATRTKTVWQVKLLGPLPAPLTCASEPAAWQSLLDRTQDGRLNARAEESATKPGPCVVPGGAGYRRLENQLYRVEVHAVAANGRVNELKIGIALYFKNGFAEGIKVAMAQQALGMAMMKSKRMSPMELLGGHKVKDLGGLQKMLKKAEEIETANIKG